MDRLDELKRQVESFSEQELAEFRAWFDNYDGDFATAERRCAALKAGESATYSLDEVERLPSLDEAGSTDVVGKK
jgi:hypothetical protein